MGWRQMFGSHLYVDGMEGYRWDKIPNRAVNGDKHRCRWEGGGRDGKMSTGARERMASLMYWKPSDESIEARSMA